MNSKIYVFTVEYPNQSLETVFSIASNDAEAAGKIRDRCRTKDIRMRFEEVITDIHIPVNMYFGNDRVDGYLIY